MSGISLPLHSVISFSVINYVVSMRLLRVSDDVSFCFMQIYKKVAGHCGVTCDFFVLTESELARAPG